LEAPSINYWIYIIPGIFATIGVILTGIFAIINSRVNKQITFIEEKRQSNDTAEIENNIIEKVLPVLERKDMAIDRIADIEEDQNKQIKWIIREFEQFRPLLQQKCQAPVLLRQIHRLRDDLEKKEVSREDLLGFSTKDDKKDN
jgi:hypothetical protein